MTPDKAPRQPDFDVVPDYAETPLYYDSMPKSSGHEYKGIPISDEQWPIFQERVAEINAQYGVEEQETKIPASVDDVEAALEAQRDAEVNYGFIKTPMTDLLAEAEHDPEPEQPHPFDSMLSSTIVNAVYEQVLLAKTETKDELANRYRIISARGVAIRRVLNQQQ